MFGMLRMVLGAAYSQNRGVVLVVGGNDGVVVHLRGVPRALDLPPRVASENRWQRQSLAPTVEYGLDFLADWGGKSPSEASGAAR